MSKKGFSDPLPILGLSSLFTSCSLIPITVSSPLFPPQMNNSSNHDNARNDAPTSNTAPGSCLNPKTRDPVEYVLQCLVMSLMADKQDVKRLVHARYE